MMATVAVLRGASALVWPPEADDALQETMLRAWRASAGFDGRSSVRAWLYRIVLNHLYDDHDFHNRAQRDRRAEVAWPDHSSMQHPRQTHGVSVFGSSGDLLAAFEPR